MSWTWLTQPADLRHRIGNCSHLRSGDVDSVQITIMIPSPTPMLSQTSEYALRIMAFLAQQPLGSLVPAVAMHGQVRVPTNYRSKILNQLTKAGLLESTRGRTGGFRLARPASRIRLLDVVAPFEPMAPTNACLLGRARCSAVRPCAAHEKWRELGAARDAFLRGTTVADVATEAGA